MIRPLPREEWSRRIGGSYKGYIFASFHDLVDTFGYPNNPEGSADGKVQLEWILEIEETGNKWLLAIYPWKNNSNPWLIERWHIGCHRFKTFDLFIEIMKEKGFDTTRHKRLIYEREGVSEKSLR